MELYKEHGVNPFSSIILLIVQIPIMLAFYWVVRSGFSAAQFSNLYAFIPQPQNINGFFLHLVDLTKPNIILILLAALAQYFQARLAIYRAPAGSVPSAAEKIARQMAFVAPLITILIFYNLPSAIGLYWLVSSLFSVGQQYIINQHLQKKYGA
jgi:YidC/Oxa1 family membrane protein insertase